MQPSQLGPQGASPVAAPTPLLGNFLAQNRIELGSTAKLLAASAAVYPRSQTNLAADSLSSRVNFRPAIGISVQEHYALASRTTILGEAQAFAPIVQAPWPRRAPNGHARLQGLDHEHVAANERTEWLLRKRAEQISGSENLRRVLDTGIMAILRAPSSEQLTNMARALFEGGIDIIEVTLTVPGALES